MTAPESKISPSMHMRLESRSIMMIRSLGRFDVSIFMQCNIIGGMLNMISPLASSIFAPATSLMDAEFHNDSATLTTFTVSFFILGYVVGSLIAAPLSEQYGRKVILDITTAIFAIWQLACALAPNITSLLVFRLFAGLGGSACLSIGGGIVLCWAPS
ncbi:hypothetical protein ONZ43_g2720 [Nemania bipapillata]|uniref:Uncharacterized protein n=1 Tax=Nemania bipapillata TaxID=110536 RepID=A0ACC2IZM2_9PEZI|nr:hypothetical protein ONZ43_g2720 [Nemania bipapillata]